MEPKWTEGDGADRGRTRPRAAVAESGAERPKQDPEHGVGEGGVVVEGGADPLGDGEDPLAEGERQEDVVVQMCGDLYHPPGVAGGADAAALHEKATRRSAAQSSHRTRPKPWARIP